MKFIAFLFTLISCITACSADYSGTGSPEPAPSPTGTGTVTPPPPPPSDAIVARWDPPAGYVQVGPVVLENAWADPSAFDKTLCVLVPNGSGFACSPALGAGTHHFNVKRADSRTTAGMAWVLDQSCDGPWAGCGKDFGTVSFWRNGRQVPFDHEPGSAGAPYYNGVLSLK